MRLRWAVILIALLPLLLASLGMAWLVKQRSQVLADLHLEAVQPVLLAARRDELQSFVNLGRSSIAHLVRDGRTDPELQAAALQILQRLEFGYDGYFFVFDYEGRVLLYPRRPGLVGENLSDVQDNKGRFPIRQMLAQARAGGGYVEVEWDRPSTGQKETRLSYVEPIAGWEWVLGTGTYVDEPARAKRRIAQATEAAVADTLWRVGIIAVLCTLGATLAAVFINLSEQRKADTKLRAMAAQIVTSQEAERARVARELHDGVSQSLVSAKYVFESAQEHARQTQADPSVTQGLGKGIVRLQDVLAELRRISHNLRPALLDDLGLAQALEHLGREWSARTAVRVVTQCAADAAPSTPPLPGAVETAIFRVAQEALGNIEAHASAHLVQIRLHRDSAALELHVQDDGCGFDADRVARSARAGLGLTHMRERIEQLGGDFTLTSGAQGTHLRARFGREALT
jgi:two-component system NarL family sensor kinase